MAETAPKSTTQSLSRQQFWEQHLQDYPRSGLSRMAYCREHGLTYHQMLYWQKRAATATTNTAATKPGSATKLVPVALRVREPTVALTVVLPNGIQIRDIQPGNLSALNALLEQLR